MDMVCLVGRLSLTEAVLWPFPRKFSPVAAEAGEGLKILKKCPGAVTVLGFQKPCVLNCWPASAFWQLCTYQTAVTEEFAA